MSRLLAALFGWTDSSSSDISSDLFVEELESDLLPSEEEEVPFARHGPVVEPDLEVLATQRDFWSRCAIGYLLDYRKFSVSHLQHLINSAWRIKGAVSIVGRESYFYIFHFEFLEELIHICSEDQRQLMEHS